MMSSPKRRKLSEPPEQYLSAFAARKALRSTLASSQKVPSSQPETDKDLKLAARHKTSTNLELKTNLKDTNDGSSPGSEESELVAVRSFQDVHSDSHLSSFESRLSSQHIAIDRLLIRYSSFNPRKNNVKQKSGSLHVRLQPGERLVLLGQCEITVPMVEDTLLLPKGQVQNGQCSIMGMTLSPSNTPHQVVATSSHALPVIRCAESDINHCEIQVSHCENGLESLQNLSPLFGKLWNAKSGPLESPYDSLVQDSKTTTFRILFRSSEEVQKSYIPPLVVDPKWYRMINQCSTLLDRRPRIVLVCGPKASGKSTFTKLLTNKLLSVAAETKAGNGRSTGVALLDLDPGQPEYSPPGQLTLVYVREPNFGPPFSHPVPGSKSEIVRSHFIGAISPSLDPTLYMACALNLFIHCKNLVSKYPDCPLIINTPGWVLGTGLEILVDLIVQTQPSDVIYMSEDGPEEVVEALVKARTLSPVHILPSQQSEYMTRTAAHLRTMQYMAYFHLNPVTDERLSWNGQPLTSIRPWEIRYTGVYPGIVGVICYGEQPPANLLSDTINGSLVAVVVIDDKAAIPGWGSNEDDFLNDEDSEALEEPMAADPEMRASDEAPLHPEYLHRPLIVQTPDEEIPYFNPANAICLDPEHSHSLGLALVRGIDVARRRLQLLTPITSDAIEEVIEAGKMIVLVHGKLDTPGWAYTEDMTQQILSDKAAKLGFGAMDIVSDANDADLEDEDEGGSNYRRTPKPRFHNAPWIERLEGSQGRGLGSRVWRVRRDLGRSNAGE